MMGEGSLLLRVGGGGVVNSLPWVITLYDGRGVSITEGGGGGVVNSLPWVITLYDGGGVSITEGGSEELTVGHHSLKWGRGLYY